MKFIRDDMVPAEMAAWRYGMDPDGENPDWFCNLGHTADDISLALFGA